MPDIISLNDRQKEAIKYNAGPLLIVAGAGTGKTTVIVEKIKHIIDKNLAKPEEILALTFTEKAAREMEERVDKALPYGYFQMYLSTFHSFADQILREELINIGLNPAYKLMTSAESIMFMRRNLFMFDLKYFRPLGNPNKFIESLLQHFSRLADEDITPEDYLQFAKNQSSFAEATEDKEEKEKTLELAQAYKLFQNLKIKEGYMDFSDLITYLIKVFRQRKNILKKYQQKFKYVLVDEFQDTNIAQYALIKLIKPPENNPFITMVGDDSQAIYKFRGASVSNILTFMQDYKKANQITLINNYRSNQTILDASYKLIKNNDPDTLEAKLGISKKLISSIDVRNGLKPFPSPVSFHLFDKVENEADFIASEISKLNNYKYSDFAVLVRANKHANPIIRALTQKGIPYQFLGPGMLYKQPEVKDLIAYMKVLYNLEDSPAFYRVLIMDIFEIDIKDLSMILIFAKKINHPLFQAVEIYLSFFEKELSKQDYEIYKKYIPITREDTKTKLLSIYKMINKQITLTHEETAGQILYYFLENSKYLNLLSSPKTEEDEKKLMNISKFFDKLKRFETEHEDASITAVVDYIEMCLEIGESPTAEDLESFSNAVNILTVHASKGLEFPVVFLINLTKGRFPTYEKKETIPIPQELIKEILPEGDYHLEEERRLFYVGMTRGKDQVYLTTSNYYGEGKRERKISPFVIETLGEKAVERYIKLKHEEKKQLTIFDYKEPVPIPKSNINKYLNYFSFSQIQTFETCPLLYKYQYILKIPTLPSGAASFGETIHKTLQKFYQEFNKNKDVDLNKLFEIYQSSWIPLGYHSLDHQKRMKKEGTRILADFYNKFHQKDLKIIDLERFFKIKIDKDLFVTGKIDRVDAKDNGNIEIIDYKTGKKPDEKTLKKSLQLSIYALAATDQGLYQKNLTQVTLTFYYLDAVEKISMTRTEKEIQSLKEELYKTVNMIRKGEFAPQVGPWCSFCSFKIICEAWQ